MWYDEPTLPFSFSFSFLAPEVFHHLDPNPAAVDFPNLQDLARVDADEL
jgi:hypothetical protein